VRSSRVFSVLLLLLGLALLWRGLQWYDGYLAGQSAGPRLAAVSRPVTRPRPTPKPTPTPAPTPTPRPISACLSLRPGENEIGAAIAALEEEDAVWPGSVDHALCLVEALGGRATEDPDRIRDALIPFAFSLPGRLRGAALEGLSKVPLQEMTPGLRRASQGAVSASMPVRAALALGLDEETVPHLVEEWLASPEPAARSTIRLHLVTSPKRAAAVFVADQLAREPGNRELVSLATEREHRMRDVSDALADVALDETRPSHERRGALEALGSLGDPAVVSRLEPLRAAAEPALRAYAEAATAALRSRHR
jgi:hypothetical protein